METLADQCPLWIGACTENVHMLISDGLYPTTSTSSLGMMPVTVPETVCGHFTFGTLPGRGLGEQPPRSWVLRRG